MVAAPPSPRARSPRHAGHVDRRPEDDDGTPVDGSLMAPPPPEAPPAFVAGEIDVPTPPPEVVDVDGVFTSASSLLGPRGADGGSDPRR